MAIKCHTRRWTCHRHESYVWSYPFLETVNWTQELGAEITQKRFWKDVGIQQRGDSLVVTLDNRALKTPSGKVLRLPVNKSLPASLIAAEWDHQETVLKPHALPMVRYLNLWLRLCWFMLLQTSIVSRAVDAMNDEATRDELRKALVKYIHTDTVW